jgi:non-specific serine/threonine protein kinase
VAADVADAYPDGVWMFELAAAREEIAILSVVISRLGTPPIGSGGAAELAEHLCQQLQPRRALLVFDNCEHVVAIVAGLVHKLLSRCPDVTIVATSREPLRVPGEVAYPVSPLPVPSSHFNDPGALHDNDSVALFYDRARAARPSFRLDSSTAPAVVAICRRLDGMPLAIELAASRVRSLAVSQIAARLDDCFHVLVGGSRTVPRQQTLQATLDWSHDLLTADEQAALRRLAVFPDWFGLEAAIDVITGSPDTDSAALDLISELVDKSLVVANSGAAEVCYRLLEPIRQYAHHKLIDAGEGELAGRRHRDFFVSYYATGRRRVLPHTFLLALAADDASCRAALEWSWDHDELDAALDLAPLVNGRNLGRALEGRQWLERLFAAGAIDERPARAKALVVLALLVHESGEPDPAREQALTDEAICIADRLHDEDLWAWLAYSLGELNLAWGRNDEARAALERGVALYSAFGSCVSAGWCHELLGWLEVTEHDFDRAHAHFERAADLARQGDDDLWLAAHALAALAPLTVLLGDAAPGQELARQALQASKSLDIAGVKLMALERAAETAILANEEELAASHIAELLGLLRGQYSRRWVADALENAAVVLDARGAPQGAAELLRTAHEVRRASGERLGGTRALAGRVHELAQRLPAATPTGRSHLTDPEQAITDALNWLQ